MALWDDTALLWAQKITGATPRTAAAATFTAEEQQTDADALQAMAADLAASAINTWQRASGLPRVEPTAEQLLQMAVDILAYVADAAEIQTSIARACLAELATPTAAGNVSPATLTGTGTATPPTYSGRGTITAP